MEPILLTERCEYEYCVARGYEPLLDIRNFRLDIRLRVELQRELFGHCVLGRGDIPVANQRFSGGFGSISRTDARKRCDLCTIFGNVLFPYINPWGISGNGA